MRAKNAFTLIELLIVVAIIAILAAIAVPNFLEAQTRSKVSRAKADIRSLATAIEAYMVDNNCYPLDGDDINPFSLANYNCEARLNILTTPLAYMSSVPRDPFHMNKVDSPSLAVLFPGTAPYSYAYLTWGSYLGFLPMSGPGNAGSPNNYGVVSLGPNEDFDTTSVTSFIEYDPTNGTISKGDIIRLGGTPLEIP